MVKKTTSKTGRVATCDVSVMNATSKATHDTKRVVHKGRHLEPTPAELEQLLVAQGWPPVEDGFKILEHKIAKVKNLKNSGIEKRRAIRIAFPASETTTPYEERSQKALTKFNATDTKPLHEVVLEYVAREKEKGTPSSKITSAIATATGYTAQHVNRARAKANELAQRNR
jgi:hypothetical protein